MLERLADVVVRIAGHFMWTGFLALIGVVALQVATRNIFHIPMIWTGDMAQFLFTWLIFVGAAVGWRRGVHYTVDILPQDRPLLRAALAWISVVATLVVVYILLWHGWKLARFRASGVVQSLGFSRFWMFLPLPVSGAMMLVFLAESTGRLLAGKTG